MEVKQSWIIGVITVLLLVSGVFYLTLNNVQIRVDNDQTTFYVKLLDENGVPKGRWLVAGRETGSIFEGSSKINRDTSKITVEQIINGNQITIIRTTPYIRGPILVDTYQFDGSSGDLELFPISHTVKITNAKGFFYRYEVRDLDYDGPALDLQTTTYSFGKNMKVVWDDGYNWAKVYASGILKVQYKIQSNDQTFNVRLFDPIPGLGLTDSTIINTPSRCVSERNNMQVSINPCIAQDLDGKNIVQYVDFKWNGEVNQNTDWIFAYEGELDSGKMELLTNVTEDVGVTVEVNRWVTDYLVTNIASYEDLGIPNSACEIGNQNNTKMYRVLDTNSFEKVYCFTSVTPVSASSFKISGNYDNFETVMVPQTSEKWVDVSSNIEYMGYNLLNHGMSYYKVRGYAFSPGQELHTKWTYTASDGTKQGKWHILGTDGDITFNEAIQQDRYVYMDPWWDASWGKKKIINITEGSGNTVSNYSVKLNITYNGNMNITFSDLRFTNSAEDTELYYYLESKVDGNSAMIWVNVPELTGSSLNQIYMYYNNPLAESTSNPVNSFLFYDTFDILNTTVWNTSGCSSCTVGGGQLNVTMPLNSYKDISYTQANFTNVSILSFYKSTLTYTEGLVLRKSGTYAGDNINNRYVISESTSAANREDTDYYNSAGTKSNLANFAYTDSANTWYYREGAAFGSKLVHRMYSSSGAYLGGVNITNTALGSGYVGIFNQGANGERNTYEFFRVRSYVEPEPTYVLGSEENPTGDNEYPQFTNYWDNNGTINNSGYGTFNTTVTSTNGTVWLVFDETTYYASNVSGNATTFNVSFNLDNWGTYSYYWSSYGNGTGTNLNISETLSYTVVNTRAPNVQILSPMNTTYNVSEFLFMINCTDTIPTESAWYTYDGGLTNKSLIPDLDNSDGQEQWVMLGNTYDNQMYYNGTMNVSTLSNNWNYSVGDQVYTIPVVENDIVYFGSMINERKYYGVNATNGSLIWEFQGTATGAFASYPTIANGFVWVGDDAYEVRKFNATTGEQVCNITTGSYIDSGFKVLDNVVYFADYDGSIYALNETNCSLIRKTQDFGSPGEAIVAIDKGFLYAGTTGAGAYKLNLTTFEIIWNTNLSTKTILSGMTYSDDKVYFINYNPGIAYIINATNGTEIANYSTGSTVSATLTPAVVNDAFYFTALNGNLYKLNATNASLIWASNNGVSNVNSNPVVLSDDKVIITNASGFAILNDTTGGLLHSESWGTYGNGFAITRGHIYFSGFDSKLHSYIFNTTSISGIYQANSTLTSIGSYTADFYCNNTLGILNDSESVTFRILNLPSGLTVTLNNPTDDSTLNNHMVNFNCSADNIGNTLVDNVTLFIDNIQNKTEIGGVSSSLELFTQEPIPSGAHTWYCLAYNNESGFSNASAYNFNVAINISGYVLDSSSVGIPNARVSIMNVSGNQTIKSMLSGDDGYYTMGPFPTGNYTVWAFAPTNASREGDIKTHVVIP